MSQTFRGDVEGQGGIVYLMTYVGESSARFVGQQRIAGSLGASAFEEACTPPARS